jgi:hypothetical protein
MCILTHYGEKDWPSPSLTSSNSVLENNGQVSKSVGKVLAKAVLSG